MIKIASMVGAPDLETPTLAPYSGDLDTAFRKLCDLGYDGIELMTKKPNTLDGKQLGKLLDQNGLKLAALCTGHMYGEDKLGLVTPQLKVNREAIDRVKQFVDFVVTFFNPDTMINIGRARGVGNPMQKAGTLDCAREAFQELADYALSRHVRLILEPVSRNEVNFIHSTLDGLALVRLVNRPNFGLLLDTYHMYREDKDPIQSLYDAAPYIWHIHFSDGNRRWPGNGNIPFGNIIDVLGKIGYEGYIGVEIQPWPDPDSAARLSIENIRRFIPSINSIGGKDGR